MSASTTMNAVVLDEDDWLPVYHVSRRIALAVGPNRRQAAGVSLITTKLTRSASGDAPWLPYPLTPEDREQLARILPLLPTLHSKMTDSEKAAFLRAYTELPLSERPTWIPSIPSDLQLFAESVEILELTSQHKTAIERAVRERAIRAIGPNHIPVTEPDTDTRVSREDVLKYLKNWGLAVATTPVKPSPIAEEGKQPSGSGHMSHTRSSNTSRATWFQTLDLSTPAKSASTSRQSLPLPDRRLWPMHKKGAAWSPEDIAMLEKLRSQIGTGDAVTWESMEAIFDCSRQNLEKVLKSKRRPDRS